MILITLMDQSVLSGRQDWYVSVWGRANQEIGPDLVANMCRPTVVLERYR